ncbi:MAG: hypothetical protein KBS76_03775 [Ruminococcus sp.]|nr:hypothetical protein [Candidatus Apopatosoma intestinale]
MKVFQIHDGICFRDYTKEYGSAEAARSHFSPSIRFEDAPDTVFEGWGYENGEFIRPIPPEGWYYDPETGTFYDDSAKEGRYKALAVRKIRAVYPETKEFQILRETLAYPDNEEVQAAFADYHATVERCLAEARAEVYGVSV